MASIETLPAPQDVYPGERIPLFGLFSRSSKSHEECHFYLDSIVENQIFTMETPCCGHTSHCRCFQKWVVLQSTHNTSMRILQNNFPSSVLLMSRTMSPGRRHGKYQMLPYQSAHQLRTGPRLCSLTASNA